MYSDNPKHLPVQFSPLTDRVVRGHKGQFSRDPFSVFSAGGPCEQFWHGQRCPLFDVVHPAFPLPITALPTLQDALKDVLVEAVVECDMPKPWFGSYSRQLLVFVTAKKQQQKNTHKKKTKHMNCSEAKEHMCTVDP